MSNSWWMRGVVVLVLATLSFTVLGCPKEDKGPKGTEKNPWVIGMSQCNLNEPWRVQMNKDIKDAASKHDNLKVVFKDASNIVTTQQDQVLEFITQEVDLIIVSPKESKPLKGPIDEAIKAGIPVVVLDRDVEGKNYTCFIGGDNYLIGKAAGEYVAKTLNGKGSVVEMMGLLSSEPGKDRHEGFVAGLGKSLGMYKGDKKGNGGINVVYAQNCEWLEEKVAEPMASALAKNAKIDLVYAHNDPMAHGAWLAAQEEGKGREKTIKFVGIDALPKEGMKYVEQGVLTATFYYPTLGPEAIDTALKILTGEKYPKRITLPTKLYTKENIAQGGEVMGEAAVSYE